MKKDEYRDFSLTYYDEDFYIGRIKSNYVDYHPSLWMNTWHRDITKEFTDLFERRLPYLQVHSKIDTILVVGAAFGFEVKVLREMGFKAEGFDCSEYAVKNAVIPIKLHNVIDELPYEPDSFDLVICNDVLEHIPEEYIKEAIRNIERVAKKWAIIKVPLSGQLTDRDMTHFTINPVKWWCDVLSENGFQVWKGWYTKKRAEIMAIKEGVEA